MLKTNIFYKTIFGVGLITILSLGYAFISQNEVKTNPKLDSPEKTFENNYNVFSLEVPKSMNFAGEPVPLNQPDIYERMDRELLVNTYWQSNGILLIKRAKKYFPVIEPILKTNGVPDDFKYLAVAESGLTPIVSPAGATGFWQIMKSTAREYGLEVNSNVDERYHIEKATQVACDYLKEAKEKFGTWTLAAASYNAGMAGISNQMERQKAAGYYNLLLNEETERYVFRILALKEILGHPEKYAFNIEESHLYKQIETKTIEVDTPITDIPDFADTFGLNYKQFKIHNPWLRDNYLVNRSRKVYQIKIPIKNQY
ncbi:lytic transglycosylase domain-containing protein [Mesohalobacter halotolerans]|uniref:Lytic transglycosylase domain-containing protein n=1 Tax=Mesohalobacter halotolerans TaxID=1883405 RepID=A0A4U5TP19_9FLAO|nr:lytic transglycosylase domain-containing protein [Mesohalobacter halotolerans]MBS3737503.1 lytic transglycosylase domain-containing protein [Psychroflexus sp.]TKS55686.1 lytic transglycosylase domain-containing protein [Mesohalobacter halotolerans]